MIFLVLLNQFKRSYLLAIKWPLRSAYYRTRSYLRRLPLKCTPWIHYPGDGRPMPRHVYLDGKEINRVIYVNLRKGFLRQHYDPVRKNPRGNAARWRKRWGEIVIQYEDGHIE